MLLIRAPLSVIPTDKVQEELLEECPVVMSQSQLQAEH